MDVVMIVVVGYGCWLWLLVMVVVVGYGCGCWLLLLLQMFILLLLSLVSLHGRRCHQQSTSLRLLLFLLGK